MKNSLDSVNVECHVCVCVRLYVFFCYSVSVLPCYSFSVFANNINEIRPIDIFTLSANENWCNFVVTVCLNWFLV